MTATVVADAAAAPTPRVRRRVRALLWIFVAGAAVFLFTQTRIERRRAQAVDEAARASARQQASDGAKFIDGQLSPMEQIARALADDLSRGRLPEAGIMARLESIVNTSPQVFTAGVAYVPGESSAHLPRFAPHAGKIAAGDTMDRFDLAKRYDYTTYDWFNEALHGAAWSEPYFGLAASAHAVSYGVPFSRPGDPSHRPIGVARITCSLDEVRDLVSSVSLGQTGYGFLLSRKGVYLSFPDDEVVRRQQTIADVARDRHTEGKLAVFQRALNGESPEVLIPDGQTGRLLWAVMAPVKTTGWVFGIDYFPDEVSLDARDVRRGYVRILGAALLLLFALSLVAVHVERGGHRELWGASIALGVLLVLGIATTWWLTTRYPDRNGETSTHILDQASLRKFLSTNLEQAAGDRAPIDVPTGVLVRTIRFIDANDVVVTGKLWQRIPLAHKADVKAGVEMPDAESLDLQKEASEIQGDAELTSWSFRTTLREPSQWSQKYPFDRALIRLRMIGVTSPFPVVLVPDFAAYDLLIPTELPGVRRSLILPGWHLDHSYFSYVEQLTRLSAAAPANLQRLLHHDFAFNVVAERMFLDPFVSSVLPIIVIAALLFGLLVVGSKVSVKVSATGFKTTDVLRAGVSLLFPALVAQVNLRGKVGANEVIYIEYFYFVLYVAILGVSANALTFTLGRAGVSQLGDNLVPKLLFWPALLGTCFAVTLAFLY
jgi:hypothetical protein